jgi:hypothetical protein
MAESGDAAGTNKYRATERAIHHAIHFVKPSPRCEGGSCVP